MTAKFCFVTILDKYFFRIPHKVQTDDALTVCFQCANGIGPAGSLVDQKRTGGTVDNYGLHLKYAECIL